MPGSPILVSCSLLCDHLTWRGRPHPHREGGLWEAQGPGSPHHSPPPQWPLLHCPRCGFLTWIRTAQPVVNRGQGCRHRHSWPLRNRSLPGAGLSRNTTLGTLTHEGAPCPLAFRVRRTVSKRPTLQNQSCSKLPQHHCKKTISRIPTRLPTLVGYLGAC